MYRSVVLKTISVIVIMSMVINLIPLSVYGKENTAISTKKEDKIVTNTETKGKVIDEIIDKRERNIKYFYLNNNTVEAAIYPNAVHYMQDGKWIDIDNSLSEIDDTDGQKIGENKSNSFKVKFAKEATDNKLISIKSDKMDIKWSLEGAETAQMQTNSLAEDLNVLNKKEDKTLLKNISSSVIYTDIMKNVDISYDIVSETVKENIILKTVDAAENKFIFNLDIGDLEAKLNIDKSISIYNSKNELVSKIDAPFMYDSKLEYSDAVDVLLTKNNKEYTLEIKPNEEWLNNPERVFPVKIDPTVNTSLYYQDIKDTYIYDGDYNNPTRYQAHIVRAGGGISKIFRSLIKFTLPTLNAGDQVIDAQLNLCNYPDTEEWNPWTGPLQINVHKVTSDWQQESAYWSNTANIYDPKIVDYMTYQYDASNSMKQNAWNITSIVKDWYVTGNNYGLMLKENTEAITGHNEAYFLSADTTAAYYLNYRPVVTITYRNQTGLENYWSYHNQTIGRAGTSSINDYNGNLVLTHGDAATPGNRMPVSINHVFNTNDKNKDIGFGPGWRLNISQMVSLETIGSTQYAKYIDEDGTAHYFLKQGTTNTYLDEDGLGLTLTYNSDTTFTMKDKGDNVLTFEKKVVSGSDLWHLNKITDANGNSINITFLAGYPNNFYIDKVTDGAGSKITFGWAYGYLNVMIDQNSKVLTYGYDANWKLTSITYPDSKQSIYTYDTNSLMTSAKNIDNSHVDYSYNVGMPYRINTVKEYSTANELGNSLSFVYGNNATTFTDNKGFSNTYSFTNAGHAVSISDFGNNTNNINNAYGKMYKYGTSGGENNKLKLESKLMTPVINRVINSSGEADGNWTHWYWGVNNGSISMTNTQSYFGSRSIKVVANGNNSTSRMYGYQWATLEKGKTYTLSAYVKTEGITNNNGGGAMPFIYYYSPTGTKSVDATSVNGTSDWKKYSCTFTYSTDATSDVVIAMGIKTENGTAYFDGVQLEEGETANTYNLIENSGFDNGLTSWIRNSDCNMTNDNVVSIPTGNAVKITGESTKRKNICQNVKISGKKGDVFSLSGWVKSNSVALSAPRANSITAGICRLDGTFQWVDVSMNPDSNTWQYSSNEFVVDSDYSYIDIYILYYYNSNEVYFDNIGLFKDDFGQSYTYDKNGNLISSQDMAKKNSSMQYNGKNELLKQTDPKGGSFTYEYDSKVKNRLLVATNNSKIKYSLEYDGYGNTISTTVNNTDKVSTTVVPGKTYHIKSKSSGLYMDADNWSTANGTNVQQYQFHGGTNQQWKAYDAGDGYYYFKPIYSDNITLDTSSTTNNIQLWALHGGDNQKWKLEKNSDDSFKIIVKSQEQTNSVTVAGDSKVNCGNIGQEKYENKESQSFYFEEVGVDNSIDKSIIESGEVFYIKSKSSGLYLDYAKDLNGNILSDANGVYIAQREYNASNSQLWRISRRENGTYKLVPLASDTGRALTVSGNVNENNRLVEMWSYHEAAPEQNWVITKKIDDTYSIMSNSTQKYLTILNNSILPEATMVIYSYTGTANQQWYLEPANMVNIEDTATYKIKNKNSGLYVGVKDSGDFNGTNVEQVAASDNLSQQWQFVDLKNGYYKLIAKHSATERVMDITDGSTADGTNVQLYQSTGTNGQQWEVVPIGNGAFSLKPRNCSGKEALDLYCGLTAPGTNIQIWSSHGEGPQQFYLEKVSGPTSSYIESKASYTTDGRFLNKITDARGKEVSYNYNFNETTDTGSGTLASVVDAKGTTTSYEYDNLDRMTSVTSVTDGKTYTNSYTYVNDKLSSILHNGFNLNFVYDNFGNTKEVKVENQTLVTNNYDTNNGNLNSVLYGNNQTISYVYDRFSRVSTKTGTDGTYNYVYDAKGNLAVTKDNVNNVTYNYTYDLADRPVKLQGSNGYSSQYKYDNNSNINNITYNFGSLSNATSYAYDSDNKITNIKWDNDKYTMYNYDKLSRLQDKYLKSGTNSYKTSMTYVNDETNSLKTTTLLSSIKNGTEAEILYTYDDNGNIDTISKDFNLRQRYYYDGLNQLVRENNIDLNQTISYTYDTGGNLTSKDIYEYTTDISLTGLTKLDTKTYTYDTVWKDKLTNYNGKDITYDNIGNPLTYDGNTYTWQNGRQLAGISKEGTNISYKYNDSGIRTQKTVNGVTTNYYLEGDKVIYETTGTNTTYYTYDGESNLVGFKYNNTQYYYVRNGQGDITGILDNNLTNVISYTYDTWGNLVSIKDASGTDVTSDTTSIGNINPYRYRGYRYDNETGMYYLQSRYYNPETCRMLNADSISGQAGDILSTNMYSYCKNNPVNYCDPSGHFSWAIPFLTSAIASIVTLLAPVIVTALVVVIATVVTIALGDAVANAIKKDIEKKDKIMNGPHTVYRLVDPDTKETKYVGRTTNPVAREQVHKATPGKTNLNFVPVASGLTREQARGMEQQLILAYQTTNLVDRLSGAGNKINGISSKNQKWGIYMEATRSVSSTAYNLIEDEILYYFMQ
ncbi:MAG: RICIN domain-containing protein [Clostridia bacterium]|nr:RICIN domain-containing protein [Clostridia bacterium]MDD4386588.1 RICIN domain-containing protein [Clostridia bacterium]